MKYFLILLSLLSVLFLSTSIAEDDFQDLLLDISEDLDSEFTSGATKSLESSLGVPAIVKVFNSAQIRKYNSLYDVVHTVPGVIVDEGPWGRKYVQIRNMNNTIYNSKTLFMVNGFKIAESSTSNFDLDTIPIESVKRLEVIRGPGSVLYGSSAYSGVINVVTFDASGYDRNSYELKLGTNGTFGTNLNKFIKTDRENHFFSVKFYSDNGTERMNQNSLDLYANIPNGYNNLLTGGQLVRTVPTQASDFRQDIKNYSFLGKSQLKKWSFTYGSSRVSRRMEYNEATATPFWGGVFVPIYTGAITQQLVGAGVPLAQAQAQAAAQANAIAGGVNFYSPGTVKTYSDIRQDFFGAQYEHEFSDSLKMKVLGKYTDMNEKLEEFDLNIFNVDNVGQSKELEIQFFHRPNDEWNWTLGLQREWLSFGQRSSDAANIARASAITAPILGGAALTGDFDSIQPGSLHYGGVYLQGIYKPNDKWQFLIANRRNSHTVVGHGYTPKYAVTYELRPDEYLKVMYGKAFRYPSPFELFVNYIPVNFRGSLNIKEEKVEAVEYNWVKSFDNNTKEISLTYYDMELTDFITTQGTSYANNAVPVDSTGWELEWSQKVTDDFSYWLNLTLANYVEPTSTFGPVVGEFEKMGAFGLDYTINDRWSLFTSSKYLGKRPMNQTLGLGYQEALDYHDFTLRYNHSKDHVFEAQVLNVFDEEAPSAMTTIPSPKLQAATGGKKFLVRYKVNF